jgi:hypothetical protein
VKAIRTLPTTLLLLAAPNLFAASAHVHGIGKLDVAVEANRVDVLLTAPLADLVGRERPPVNEEQRDAMLAQRDALLTGEALRFEGARCEFSSGEFSLPPAFLEVGSAGADHSPGEDNEHEDHHGHEERRRPRRRPRTR